MPTQPNINDTRPQDTNGRPDTTTIPVINRKEAVDRLGGDEEIFKNIVALFLDQMPMRCRELNEAFNRSDYESLAILAHTLKSSTATVGAMTLQSMFIMLENASRERNHSAVSQLIVQLGKEFSRYRDAAGSAVGKTVF
jgi:HPt (histidine-containing phosphotransfer) domain-containing protein